jgi:hypothetical protein
MASLRVKLLLFFAASLLGCGSQMNFTIGSEGQIFKQNGGIMSNQIDVLWVIDNSGSMAPYQDRLAANFDSFINIFVAKGFDFRIAVTTTEAYRSNPAHGGDPMWAKFRDGTDATSHTGIFVISPLTPNLNNVFITNAKQGIAGSGDERAFSSFREALLSPMNPGFLRPNSFLAVIILSDEDDFSGDGRAVGVNNGRDYGAATLDSVNSYISVLEGFTNSSGATKRFNVSSISGMDTSCGAVVATRYIDIVNKTDGVLGNICDASYASALNQIQARIGELSTQFYLNRQPQVPTIFVKVNGAVIGQDSVNGWTYNAAANSVVFHGASIPPQNAVIEVNFTPTTIR